MNEINNEIDAKTDVKDYQNRQNDTLVTFIT